MKIAVSALMALASSVVLAQDAPVGLTGDYLGQEPPGLTKQVFAPGVVSTDAPEGCLCFSSDGNHVVFRRHWREDTVVFLAERTNGRWSEPEVAPFFLKPYRFGDFTFAPDESRLYFTSNRPATEGGEASESSDIWRVDNTDGTFWDEHFEPIPGDALFPSGDDFGERLGALAATQGGPG